MRQVALKLHTLSADEVITLANDIHVKMTANATIFATPPVTMADFESAIDNLSSAQHLTLMGGKAAIIVRNGRRQELEDMLKVLASYVTTIGRDNEETYSLAGMPVKRRGPLRYDFLDTPTNVRSESVYGDAVILRWNKVANAKSYEVEYTKDPSVDSAWIRTPIVSACRTLIHGLALKEQYWFRVRATGSQGMVSGWSNARTQVVS
ncbi:MAG TPA: fibronectin type III domain-containing protein [Flavipsychrobacter sp.]|nr:fibronectin type III domain-containing protein [Flavipsychrobacter sp.]